MRGVDQGGASRDAEKLQRFNSALARMKGHEPLINRHENWIDHRRLASRYAAFEALDEPVDIFLNVRAVGRRVFSAHRRCVKVELGVVIQLVVMHYTLTL